MKGQRVRRLTAFGAAMCYFGLFTVLDHIAVKVWCSAFLIFVSFFEYYGLESLFCIDGKKPAVFGRLEFFVCTVFVPLLIYAVLTAAGVRIGGAGLSCSATCALGTAVFRAVVLAAEVL